MFGKKTPEAKVFIDALAQLSERDLPALNKTQNKALKDIHTKLEGFNGDSVESLIEFLSVKAAPAKKPRKSTGGKSAGKKPANSAALVSQIVEQLEAVEDDRSQFESAVLGLKSKYLATTVKAVTAQYAPGARPKTIPEAQRILIAERNDRKRAAQKASEAASSKPW